MSKSHYFPTYIKHNVTVMTFVDGENLAIRYGEILNGGKPPDHVSYEPNIYVWSRYANTPHHVVCDITRKYYYTSVQGDEPKCVDVEGKLKDLGIEAPRVFKKEKGRRSKRVDISLATDMLGHAHRKNYDLAVLVAGDEDYVPLVDAVMAEGRRVVLWFFENGLSPVLRRRVDHYFDISRFFMKDAEQLERR